MTDVVDERGVHSTISAPISFCVGVRGSRLSIFVDHGEQFECRDADGRKACGETLVESISQEKQGP